MFYRITERLNTRGIADMKKAALQRREELQRDIEKLEEFIRFAKGVAGRPEETRRVKERALETLPIERDRPH